MKKRGFRINDLVNRIPETHDSMLKRVWTGEGKKITKGQYGIVVINIICSPKNWYYVFWPEGRFTWESKEDLELV